MNVFIFPMAGFRFVAWTLLYLLLGYVHGFAEMTLEIKDPIGSTIRSLQWVNAGPYPSGEAGNANLKEQYRRIGVTLVRIHDFYGPLNMSQMYPDRKADPNLPSSYHFTESDIRFREIVDHGFEPYFRLGDSWNDVRPPSKSERNNWIQAAIHVV